MLGRRGCGCGDRAVGVRKLRGGGEVALQVGDQRLRLGLDRRELLPECRDGLRELRRLRDRLLGGADRERRFAGSPRRDRLGGGLDRPIRERGALLRVSGVVRHGAEGCGIVRGRQRRQSGSGRGQNRRQRGPLAADPLQLLGGVLLELAQFVERLGVLFEDIADLIGDLDDADVPCPTVLDCVLDLVVELLLEIERLGHLRLRRLDGVRELGGGALTELRDGESELFLARGDRIVGLHEGDPCLGLDLLVGERGERIVGVGRLGHRAAPPRLRVPPGAADERDDEPEKQARGDDGSDDQRHPQSAACRRRPGSHRPRA